MKLLLLFCILLFSGLSQAVEVRGRSLILDGDTIEINGVTIRLYGIDAPENGQVCTTRQGKKYNCGKAAEKGLAALIHSDVSCTGENYDQYDRLIAICYSNNREINKQMVLSGWALAYVKYSTDYIEFERTAQREKRGIWAGKFESPADFRSSKWRSALASAGKPGCPIKGNINNKGEHIYHAPWSRSYSRTKISLSRGERWFCSEDEALQAGWRAPYR